MARLPKSSALSALRPRTASKLLMALIFINVAVECVLAGSDLRLFGSPLWRTLAYQNGGFWAGLLGDWQPNYAAQPFVMFLSYGFLHAGPAHLIGNMLALWPLGLLVLHQYGGWRFAVIYLGALLSGGLAFGLLSTSPAPMVGASGAIFGLVAAVIVGDWHDQRRPWRSLAGFAGLAMLNLATWIVLQGQMAWETHLGGALGGAVLALLLRPQTITRPADR